MREGRVAVDPHRDSVHSGTSSSTGSFSGWNCIAGCCSGCTGSGAVPTSLSSPGTARLLSWQLSDEQFAVPSHPFTVALTARSLDAGASNWGPKMTPGYPAGRPDRSFRSD